MIYDETTMAPRFIFHSLRMAWGVSETWELDDYPRNNDEDKAKFDGWCGALAHVVGARSGDDIKTRIQTIRGIAKSKPEVELTPKDAATYAAAVEVGFVKDRAVELADEAAVNANAKVNLADY